MLISALIILPIAILISILLVNGIDFMDKNHPDYHGEDLFDENYDKKPNH